MKDLNAPNEYGVPLHACNGFRQDEHYWAWLGHKRREQFKDVEFTVMRYEITFEQDGPLTIAHVKKELLP